MSDHNSLVDTINKQIAAADMPTFTLAAQRKFNAFNAGIVKRSGLEFVKHGPSYFTPVPATANGISSPGRPFLTSFKPQSVAALQRQRAAAAVEQMGEYKPPSQYNFRDFSETVPTLTAEGAKVETELHKLLAMQNSATSSTQKYALAQRVARKRAALARETATFRVRSEYENIQQLQKQVAIEQQGLFDEEGLEPGDRVLVHFPGAADGECWKGPFVVVRRIGASTLTVHSNQYGQLDVSTGRVQDLRVPIDVSSLTPHKKNFVLAVGRSTAKDAVLELARDADSKRGPYKPPSDYNFVHYESDARHRTVSKDVGMIQRPVEATVAEMEAARRRHRYNRAKKTFAKRSFANTNPET